MQMVERGLMQQVSFVEEEDGVMQAVSAGLLHMRGDGMEYRAGGRAGGEAKSETELTIEVATAQRDVGAIGEAVFARRHAGAQRAEDASLAAARIDG